MRFYDILDESLNRKGFTAVKRAWKIKCVQNAYDARKTFEKNRRCTFMQIISTAVNLQYTESSEGTEFIWNIEYIKQEGGKRKLSAFYFWL